MRTGARGAAAFGALVLIIMTLGLGGTAFADPGNGQGAGQANGNGAVASSSNGDGGHSANAHADAGPAATSSSSAASSSSTGATSGPKEPAGSSSKSTSSTKQSPAKAKGSAKSSTARNSKADHSKGNAGTSGTWNQRQPNSNADQNTGGANGQCANYEGVYCSTRDGSASKNGNNVGKATGRPCAGCVGKADNKNPQGQKPDAKRDGNNGYECDGNNGIAKGNPAHTMCKPGDNVERCPDGSVKPSNGVCPTPPKTCPDGSPMPSSGVCSTPPKLCPDGSVMPPGGMSDCPKPPKGCPDGQVMVDGECVEIEPDEVTPPLPDIAGEEGFAPRPKPNAEVLGVQATADAPAVLPATGSSAGMSLMTGAGFLALAAGAGLLLRRRLA